MHPTKFLAALFLGTWLNTLPLPVGAMVFTSNLTDTPGPLDGGAVSYTVTSPGASSAPGNATLTFDLVGYISLDGLNPPFTDTFSLTINGTELFRGGFDMGGGGTTFIDVGTSNMIVSTLSNGFFAGGLTKFSIAHTLLAGDNTYRFDYGSMQGLGDEGWGLRNLSIAADITPVPLPGAVLLFGTGLLGVGLGAYGRRFMKGKRDRNEPVSPALS